MWGAGTLYQEVIPALEQEWGLEKESEKRRKTSGGAPPRLQESGAEARAKLTQVYQLRNRGKSNAADKLRACVVSDGTATLTIRCFNSFC